MYFLKHFFISPQRSVNCPHEEKFSDRIDLIQITNILAGYLTIDFDLAEVYTIPVMFVFFHSTKTIIPLKARLQCKTMPKAKRAQGTMR